MKLTDYKSLKFEQANELIKANNHMSSPILKFYYFALTKRDKNELEVTTSMSELLDYLIPDRSYSQKDEALYRKVIEAAVSDSVITVRMPAWRLDDYEDKGYQYDDFIEITEPLITAERNETTNIVKIKFNERHLPMLEDLKRSFTWIYLSQVVKLSGKYSPRIYEYCRMKLTTEKKVSFVWWLNSDSQKSPGIRNFMGFEDGQYQTWNDLRTRVLDPSIKEINEKCADMEVEYLQIKKGTRVAGIDMTVRARKTQLPEKKKKEAPKKKTVKTPKKKTAELPDYYGLDGGEQDPKVMEELNKLLKK